MQPTLNLFYFYILAILLIFFIYWIISKQNKQNNLTRNVLFHVCSGPWHSGPLSLAILLSVDAVSTYCKWSPLLSGKKWQVLRNSRPCYQDCWYIGLSWLKALAVNCTVHPADIYFSLSSLAKHIRSLFEIHHVTASQKKVIHGWRTFRVCCYPS